MTPDGVPLRSCLLAVLCLTPAPSCRGEPAGSVPVPAAPTVTPQAGTASDAAEATGGYPGAVDVAGAADGTEMEDGPEEPPQTVAEDAVTLPEGPAPLPVDGLQDAVVVAPQSSAPSPAPLVVVLHGNFDRPEWECATWAAAAAPHGWLLCTRGEPRSDVAAEQDRWTYADAAGAANEAGRAVAALGAAWPGLVDTDGAVLIGFSRGAHLAREVAATVAGVRFTALVLVEGGYALRTTDARAAREAGIERAVYVCGERTRCVELSRRAARAWKAAGAAVDTIVMDGVGHAYATDFDPIAAEVFGLLFGAGRP